MGVDAQLADLFVGTVVQPTLCPKQAPAEGALEQLDGLHGDGEYHLLMKTRITF
ncbi:hypothetical protein D9M70_595010 [compost metagenome]